MDKVYGSYMQKTRRLFKVVARLFVMADIRTSFRFLFAVLGSIPSVLKQRNLSTAYRKMWGKPCTLNVLGRRIVLDGHVFGRVTEMYVGEAYFMRPEILLREGMNVVDLGADIGAFTVLAALVGERVIAVEANKESLKEIGRNLEENHCREKADIVWALVGGEKGMFSYPEIARKVFGENPPPRKSMEEILEEHNMERVDFLKVDIEGSEYALFSGDLKWLSRVHYIAMEVHQPFASYGIEVACGDVDDIRETLTKKGFEVYLVDLNHNVVPHLEETGYLFAKNLKYDE